MKKIITTLFTALFVSNAQATISFKPALTIKAIYSEERGRNVDVYYWYPTEQEKPNFIFGNTNIFESTNVVLDADIAPGKHPIVALSHGGLKSSFTHTGWIASALSQRGYIVVAPKPPEYGEIIPEEAFKEIFLRPSDIILGISNLSDIAIISNGVDKNNISGVGFFFGATSMLILAGAKVDPKLYKRSCDTSGINIDCNWFKESKVNLNRIPDYLLEIEKEDNRIKSIILINPELTKVMDENSLKRLTVDASIIDLSAQENPALKPERLISKMPKFKRINVSSATVFSSFSICTPKGIKILSNEGESEICEDPTGYTRQENHHKILAAILKALPRPKDSDK